MVLVTTLDFKSSVGLFAESWEGSIPLRSRHQLNQPELTANRSPVTFN